MSDSLHKAVFRKPRVTRDSRVAFLNLVEAYLTEQGRTAHFVQVYYNDEHTTVVLSDRDTAVMLKLALT